MSSTINWFLSIGMRWKLQLSFFGVAMITILINRWVGYIELEHLIDITRAHNVDSNVISLLEQRLLIYIQDSIWHSAIEFVLLFIIISIVSGFLVRPILALCDALDCIEHGDLTRELKVTSLDEVGILEQRFNAMRSHLNEIMQNLDSSSKQMTNSAFQVSAISHEISEVEENEHHRTNDVTSAMNELQATLSSVHQMAVDVSNIASNTEESARQSISRVSSNISTMESMANEVNTAASQMSELNQSAQQIVEVVNSIHSIAEQTNLLALNAAIEAARAGEQGRGFAVVADEVRSLANRTSASTAEISGIIDELHDKVKSVSDTMEMVVERAGVSQKGSREIGNVIELMANEVSKTAQNNLSIANVSSEQIQKLETLQQSLQKLFSINKENHAKVETTAGIADDLYYVTEHLQSVLSEFTFEKQSKVASFSGSEHRKAPRIEYRLRVQATQNNITHGGTCIDFSSTGMKLRLADALSKEDLFELDIFVPYDDYNSYGTQNPLKIKARVVWTSQQGEFVLHGIEYIDTTEADKSMLQKCITYFDAEQGRP